MIEFQWGKNPEYTLYLYHNWNMWYLPFGIHWHHYDGGVGKMYSVGLSFLNLGISFEIWKWGKI